MQHHKLRRISRGGGVDILTGLLDHIPMDSLASVASCANLVDPSYPLNSSAGNLSLVARHPSGVGNSIYVTTQYPNVALHEDIKWYSASAPWRKKTFTLWARPIQWNTNPSHLSSFFGFRTNASPYTGLYVFKGAGADANLYVAINSASSASIVLGQPVLGDWVFIAIAYDSETKILRGSLNGVPFLSTTISSPNASMDAQQQRLVLSRWAYNSSDHRLLQADFCNLRVYDRVLSDEEIAYIYSNFL